MSVIRRKKPDGCSECPFFDNETVWGCGSKTAIMMNIGDYPRKEDARTGRPYSGFAKERIRTCYNKADIVEGEVYTTYAVKCVPNENIRSTSPEMKKAVACCRPLVQEEIDIIHPEVVILQGELPLNTVMEVRKIGDYRGAFHDYKGDDSIQIMPTNSIMSVFHNPKSGQVIENDFKEAGMKLAGKSLAKTEVRYYVCDDLPKLKKWVKRMHQLDFISFDVETTCYDVEDKKILIKKGALMYSIYDVMLMQFGISDTEAVLVPIEKYMREQVWDKKDWIVAKKLLKGLFEDEEITFVVADVSMDIRAAYKTLGIDYEKTNYIDIQLMSNIVNENEPSDLESMAVEFTGLGAYKQELNKRFKGEAKRDLAKKGKERNLKKRKAKFKKSVK